MDKMRLSYSSFALLFLLQVHHGLTAECTIVSVTSPSASTLNVQWSSSPIAYVYVLDLRVVNVTNVAPLILMLTGSTRQRLVQGLRAGQEYHLTLSAFDILFAPLCTTTKTTMTVPATSQITSSQAISSTAITFQWSTVTGSDSYILSLEETFKFPPRSYNRTFTTPGGQIDDLTPSTTYDCYVYSSNSAGRGARSNIRTTTTLVQPPTGVDVVSTGKSTAHVTWNPVSRVLLYQVTVTDKDLQNKPLVVRNTSSTSMIISSLEPCSTYTVGVSSVNVFLVPGEPSAVTYNTTTIGVVTTVSVDYSCSSSRVTVTWDVVFGARLYRAIAVDGSGNSLNCTSDSTSCQITELKCGEKYQVYITAISDDCESAPNAMSTFETVPCAPTDLSTKYDCSSNVIVFSWEPTNNTQYYVATAVDNTGKLTECRTMDRTCYFTNVGCGQFHTYKVYAVSSECNSHISQPTFVQTSPCLPQNVRTEADCSTNTLVTTWDSSEGALSYNITAEGNNGQTYNCASPNNTCEITGVPCGEQLSVWIIASNDNCSTDKVLVEAAQTVPCTPTNVSASTECSPDSARVDWTTSHGTIFYIAVAEDTNGNSHHCYSLGTTCLIEGLQCGQNYTIKVIGTNFNCNSTPSQEVYFMTAPCPPTNIEAIRDCDTNRAVIVWQNHRKSGVYTAILEDQSGPQLNCTSSTVNNCTITSLPCGNKYNVTVTNSDGLCQSSSPSISMDSVPCGPEEVNTSVSCSSDELKIYWSIPVPAEKYTTIITTAMGPLVYCNSTDTQCTVEGLQCESSYSMKVFSITGTCLSLPSQEVTVKTLPCPPTNITVVHACSPDPIPVSWTRSGNAELFVAVALGSGGHRAECTSNKTSCTLPGLQCGELYKFTVAGVDGNCTGLQSNPVSLKTEPCPPSNVTSKVICGAGATEVFWSPSRNAESYAVRAISNNQFLSCNSSSLNCTLSPLVCGQTYDVQVAAVDSSCVSNYSTSFRQEPEPCAPENVTTDLLCDNNNVTVSWESSPLPLSYSVMAMPLDGSAPITCDTNNASCVLGGFRCGQTLNISVKASSDSCSGPYSPVQTVQTGSCSSQKLTVVTYCETNSLLASWETSPGAIAYTATVTGPNGFSENCSTSNLTCFFSGLQCASSYAVKVISQDGVCNSASVQTTATTGPCDPINVTSVLQCGSDTATVSWVKGAGAETHMIVAQEERSHQYISCWSNTTSCQLKQLQCGKVYNLTVLAGDGTCNSTGAVTETLITEPCSPSIQSSSLTCGNNSALVTWMPVTGATGFIVNATSGNGHSVSCSSNTASCSLTDLLCGQIYMTSITATGNQCDSPPRPSSSITTAPCPPTITARQYDCGTSTAVISWSNVTGSLGFFAKVVGEGQQDSCHTTNTSCTFRNLPCGLDVNVTVQAQGAECNSSISTSESLQTVLCAPQNLNATTLCSSHSALVTWTASPAAVGHNVTVTGQEGHTHVCHTNSTSCHVTDLHCGETYSITATPYSQTCAGIPSAAYSFRAGLCAPSNVTVSTACEDSTISWNPVTGTEMYIATATAYDGHNHTCTSNYSSSSCNFTDLHCGETYSATVVTLEQGCWSEPSSAVPLRAALCHPANLTGYVSCETNILTLKWGQVTGGTYVLQWEKIGSTSPPIDYTTSNISHTLSNLLCGETYAFRVAAQESDCRSSYSPPVEISTAPCQPTNLTVRVDCGTNNGNFSWLESSRASFYTVEITGEHGHVASCSSNDSSCSLKLHCGHSYSASMVASTDSCNSTKHVDIYFDSAPCLPGDVLAELDCSTNVMNVNWTQTTGSDEYSAWAISTDGHRTSCNSTSNHCSIHDLRCGRTYEVAVTSSSIDCEIIAGSDYKVQSAPCKAENSTVELNCSSNTMTVKWQDTSTSQNYTVRATSASGVNSTCETTETSCSFLDLSCGQLYTFAMTGHNNVCVSDMSDPIETHAAPCPPTSVSAYLNCTTRSAVISWTNAAATVATTYGALAASSAGHNSTCQKTGTSCNLDQLVCGQTYSVVVQAINAGCPGPASDPVTFVTEPCVPTSVSLDYNVSAAWVMWSQAEGASEYFVQAVTHGEMSVACRTNTPGCFLHHLLCSHTYNITVRAINSACGNVISDVLHFMTAPCPPTNVEASVSCDQLTATVSWQESGLALGYVAYFDNKDGHNTSCTATETDTSCVVSEWTCGSVYRVWVKALGKQYNSTDSAVVSLTSVPCQPHSIEAVVDCQAHSATVSWHLAVGAVSYAAMLTSSSGHTSSCCSGNTSCQPSSLHCGEEYNVTVTALGEPCNSTAHMAGHLITEPCAPVNLSVRYDGSNAQVMWSTTIGGGAFSVVAVTDRGPVITCNSSSPQCSLTALQCSQIYNVTVQIRSSACNSTVTSVPHRLVTAPCPPTNVQANMSCEQHSATVSWQQSELAVGYVVYVDGQQGHFTSCVSAKNETVCSVSGLMCETVYKVNVKALGEQYNSSDSSAVYLTSAPCLPSDLAAAVSCEYDIDATVYWSPMVSLSLSKPTNFSVLAIVGGSVHTLCTTQHSSCNVTGLSCGVTYNLSLTATNEQCSLKAQTLLNITTRPCTPNLVSVNLTCGNHSALISWEEIPDVSLHRASAIKSSGWDLKTCDSSGSSCSISGLDCGEIYNFTVAAYSNGCWSQASGPTFIHTEPCKPVNVSAQTLCESEEVQLSWNQTGSPAKYLVTAMGSLGYMGVYNTTRSLLTAALPCGQRFNVTVQAQGSSACDSMPSSPFYFKTGPCIPRDVVTSVQCQLSEGSVSWGPSDGAESYVATLTGLDGHTHLCISNTTDCRWTDLHCGEQYTVAVGSKADNCVRMHSNSSVIYMSSCRPQNLAATVNCGKKVVSLSWDTSNETETYMVSAETGDEFISLNTDATTVLFSEFVCGQNYNLTVTPYNQHCGNSSTSTSVQTWPCMPARISTEQDCLSSVAVVTWDASNGSDYYTATMQTDKGISETCASETNSCNVTGLTCGNHFSVSVTASNQKCNITSEETTSLQSVPCVPANVSVILDCSNNSADVSWSPSRGALRYSVLANTSHSSNDSCTASDLSCLVCGANYTVQVVATDASCSSLPSRPVFFESGPCPPSTLNTELSCLSNDLNVTWDAVRGADHFFVSLTDANGQSSKLCNTTNNFCSTSNLTCGNVYTVQVTSVRGSCQREDSQTYRVQSGPCQPQGVRGYLDCVTNSAWISWDSTPGAESYTVLAVGGMNHTANCTTSTNMTCEVENLPCGVSYSFTVTATRSSLCESPPSAPISLQTAPCSFASLTASARCHNSSILVEWELMEGGTGNNLYIVTAEVSDHTYLFCNSTGNSCYLQETLCDLHYTIIVAASTDRCSSLRSPPYRISMEPCPPKDVSVDMSCEDHSALVSWTPSPVAVTYHVVAVAPDGHEHTCNSTYSNCSVSELHCDQQYAVFVVASHENCTSKASHNATVNTGPCQPSGLSVTSHCNNQSAMITWVRSDNAKEYYGCAQSGNGDRLYCHSSEPRCTINSLICGMVYEFSVQATDGACNSSLSYPVQISGAPCPPQSVEVQLIPTAVEIEVLRFTWPQVVCGETEYQLRLTGKLLGDSQALFEITSYWTNVTYFEIPLPCGSSFIATVQSKNAAGMSNASAPLIGTTAPCPPSEVAYSGNSSFATVSWNASVFATSYTLYDVSVLPKQQLCNTTQLSCSLSSVSSGNLAVTASNTAGESLPANVTKVTPHLRRRRDLKETIPMTESMSAPLLEVTQPSGTIVFLQWSPVEDASFYTLLIRKQGSSDEDQEFTVYGESIILSDLSPDSAYCFSVFAVSADVSGAESEPVCAQTGPGIIQ